MSRVTDVAYEIGSSGQILVFAERVLTHFQRHQQRRASDAEAGGQLFAKLEPPLITVCRASGPRTGIAGRAFPIRLIDARSSAKSLMKSDIYAAFSRYSHVSLAALLDAYDPYSQDFDFDRVAGYEHLRTSSLVHVSEQILSTIHVLTTFYRSIQDADSCSGLDTLLRRHTQLLQDATPD
jgi:hypothetical protein